MFWSVCCPRIKINNHNHSESFSVPRFQAGSLFGDGEKKMEDEEKSEEKKKKKREEEEEKREDEKKKTAIVGAPQVV